MGMIDGNVFIRKDNLFFFQILGTGVGDYEPLCIAQTMGKTDQLLRVGLWKQHYQARSVR